MDNFFSDICTDLEILCRKYMKFDLRQFLERYRKFTTNYECF